MTEQIKLTKGMVALVDDEDHEWLSQCKWCVVSDGYAGRFIREHGKEIVILMHRLIMTPPPGYVVDHKNGNTLDNQKENLRICTQSQNLGNSNPRRSKGKSKYKGVSRTPHNGPRPWMAYIRKEYLGVFGTEEEAAKAYDKKARELYGEFARTNFP